MKTSMQRHILKHKKPTYINIHHVEKKGVSHMETGAKTQTEPKTNATHKQSCAA
jgi:hypothetical protein